MRLANALPNVVAVVVVAFSRYFYRFYPIFNVLTISSIVRNEKKTHSLNKKSCHIVDEACSMRALEPEPSVSLVHPLFIEFGSLIKY